MSTPISGTMVEFDNKKLTILVIISLVFSSIVLLFSFWGYMNLRNKRGPRGPRGSRGLRGPVGIRS